jgi:hypothetical protein
LAAAIVILTAGLSAIGAPQRPASPLPPGFFDPALRDAAQLPRLYSLLVCR